MVDKVKLELRPYSALAILAFCREYVNDSNKDDSRIVALHEAVKEYEDEIYKKVSGAHLDDAILENKVNELTGRHPQ